MSDIDFEDRAATGASTTFPADASAPAAAKLQGASAVVKDKITLMADQARDTVTRLTDRATTAYETAAEKAQRLGERVDPMVREKPYAALGVALAAGAVLGMLFASRSPKVIYIKPHG